MARTGGWRRTGSRRRFRYLDTRGNEVTDEAALERIHDLAIPPAWRDVWISPSARAKLQAVGVDSAGRRQYLYHPEYRAAQEQAKYDRLVLFAERLPALREAMAEHMELDAAERDRVCAVALRLIDLAWFRVGSDRYARSSRTYGVTTLTKRHVRVHGRRLTFSFRAKGNALVRTTLVDDELADAVRGLLAMPNGARLFRYRSNGALVHLTASGLNDYLREHLGEEFTAKDFRTWAARSRPRSRSPNGDRSSPRRRRSGSSPP